MKIAALFVQTDGCYSNLPNVDPWDKERDARKYDGAYPIVAHPPCQLWTRFAHVNYKRWGGDHNRLGNDGGCFASALANVERCGGVLEHPAFSYAWEEYGLLKPKIMGWNYINNRYYVCEVWQSAYGHLARKRTWLLYFGKNPPADLRWERKEGLYQIGGCDQRGKAKNKPTISGKKASATPLAFRDALIALAMNCNIPTQPNASDKQE
jgi:hypothetical protein